MLNISLRTSLVCKFINMHKFVSISLRDIDGYRASPLDPNDLKSLISCHSSFYKRD